MQIGFFFWPFDPGLVEQMAAAAERFGYDMLGIADTPGNAMDPWVAATLAAQRTEHARIALCVTNLASRHPAVTAAAAASLDLLAPGRTVLGIGAGHSGTRNLGISGSGVGELEEGLGFIRALLSGQPARSHDGGEARIPWVRRPPKLFLAASGPRALAGAGRAGDGVFVNFGLLPDNVAQSTGAVAAAARAAGRDPGAVEIWQVAALDCSRDGAAVRERLGAILAFMAAGYILGSGDLGARGVPTEFHRPLHELRRRYSTRPGAADAVFFDYLAGRFAIHGTPAECRAQLLLAERAGVERMMFTVSLAADPAAAVALFGEAVLPAVR